MLNFGPLWRGISVGLDALKKLKPRSVTQLSVIFLLAILKRTPFLEWPSPLSSTVAQMICDLGWQSLEARRAVSRLSLMYKIAYGLVDVESQILVRSGRPTRQSQGQHYRNILAPKSCYRASFFPRTVPEWNHLSPHIRNASSVDCYKSTLMRDQDINDLISKSHFYDWLTADLSLCTYIPCGRFAQY